MGDAQLSAETTISNFDMVSGGGARGRRSHGIESIKARRLC
jgi:hypothetical protein